MDNYKDMKINYKRLQQIIKEEVGRFLKQEELGDMSSGSGTDTKSLQADIDNLSTLSRTKMIHLDRDAQEQLKLHITAALAVLGG
jgi:hypothetical protein